MAAQRTYLAIDLKSFYASVECVDLVSYTHLWSHAFRQILGYHDILDFPNKLDSWSNLLHPEDYDRVMQLLSLIHIFVIPHIRVVHTVERLRLYGGAGACQTYL